MRNVVIAGVFVVVALVMLGSAGYLYYQYYGQPRCEACGMIITSEMAENMHIIDTDTNQRLYSCCAGCMLRLAAAHPNMNLEVLDSWYGTAAPATVIEIRNGSVVSVSVDTARIMLGSKLTNSCVSNRFAINATSAQFLQANGYNPSNPLSPFKTTLPDNTPLVNVSAALTALKAKGISYVPPSMAFLIGAATAGIAVLAIGLVAWKKLSVPPVRKT
jgi:hypothetical protein